MSSCQPVLEQVNRLLNNYSQYLSTYTVSLESLYNQLETLERELIVDAEPESALSVPAVVLFEQFLKKCGDVLRAVTSGHRELHASVSKCGRVIDKNFISNLEVVCMREMYYERTPELLKNIDMLIAKHYLTMGYVNIADDMLEIHGSFSDDRPAKFQNMYGIVEALRNHDIGPAMAWCVDNQEKLEQQSSKLQFYLTRLEFVQLLGNPKVTRSEVLAFARKFERYASSNACEVSALMASMVLYRRGLANSRYKYLLSDKIWEQAITAFQIDWCTLHGVPTNSPLSIILEVGLKAVTTLMNMKMFMDQGKIADALGSSDELPVEINLSSVPQYHSIFTCPILRQPTSDVNPPVRLICGHVISNDAVQRLLIHDRLKCPYCPQEMHVSRTKILYF